MRAHTLTNKRIHTCTHTHTHTRTLRFPTSIASLSFNHDGTMLAVASSYTFEEGEKDHPPDNIYIRMISDSEVRPKPRVSA